MNRLIQRLPRAPRTLFGQLLVALLLGLFAVQGVGLWLTLDERTKFSERLLGIHAAQRLAGIISLLDRAEPGERPHLVKSLNVPPTNLSLEAAWGMPNAETTVYADTFGKLLQQEPWLPPGEAGNQEADRFVEQVNRELEHPLEMRILSIKLWKTRGGGASPHPPMEDNANPGAKPPPPGTGMRLSRPVLSVAGQVKLSDGTVLTFRHGIPQRALDWPLRLFGLLALLLISVAILSAWAVRRLTRPLDTLANAATGLARNLEQPPLPETGPEEVAQAARAFNAMQRDLKRYLEARAQALAGVSHDLRLPITRIRFRIDELNDDTLRGKIENDLAEMDQMIGNTLDFLRAGSETEKPVRLDMNALVESVAEDMEALGAQVTLSGRAQQPLTGRPQALRRCLGNLMDNARRYGGGKLAVHLENHPPARATSPGEADLSPALTITIADRGPGIPPLQQEQVFEPFVRLEASRARHTGGTGLGLAIARRIARSHGGDVTLASREGGGTLAHITLTGARETARQDSPNATLSTPATLSTQPNPNRSSP